MEADSGIVDTIPSTSDLERPVVPHLSNNDGNLPATEIPRFHEYQENGLQNGIAFGQGHREELVQCVSDELRRLKAD